MGDSTNSCYFTNDNMGIGKSDDKKLGDFSENTVAQEAGGGTRR